MFIDFKKWAGKMLFVEKKHIVSIGLQETTEQNKILNKSEVVWYVNIVTSNSQFCLRSRFTDAPDKSGHKAALELLNHITGGETV